MQWLATTAAVLYPTVEGKERKRGWKGNVGRGKGGGHRVEEEWKGEEGKYERGITETPSEEEAKGRKWEGSGGRGKGKWRKGKRSSEGNGKGGEEIEGKGEGWKGAFRKGVHGENKGIIRNEKKVPVLFVSYKETPPYTLSAIHNTKSCYMFL